MSLFWYFKSFLKFCFSVFHCSFFSFFFQGNNVIGTMPGRGGRDAPFYYKKRIMVDGFGDSDICAADIRKYDTRIFLAAPGETGRELHLQSAPVRVTLKNLRQTDAAVKGKATFHSSYGRFVLRNYTCIQVTSALSKFSDSCVASLRFELTCQTCVEDQFLPH